MSVFQPRRFGLLSPPFLSVSNRNGLYVGFNQLALDPPPDCIIHDHLKIMVRLLQLRVFDTKRDQIVKCEEEPLHIAAAPGCFVVSTAAGSYPFFPSLPLRSPFLHRDVGSDSNLPRQSRIFASADFDFRNSQRLL